MKTPQKMTKNAYNAEAEASTSEQQIKYFCNLCILQLRTQFPIFSLHPFQILPPSILSPQNLPSNPEGEGKEKEKKKSSFRTDITEPNLQMVYEDKLRLKQRIFRFHLAG